MTVRYEQSLFYQIYSSAKCFDILFEQFFKEMNLGITSKEHLALIIINDTVDCCQRDLAKIMLQDRANTGKLAISLENKGYIKISCKTKNNRPVKILSLTKKGLKLNEKIKNILTPLMEKFKAEFSQEMSEEMKKNLQKLRKTVEKVIKTNI